MTTTNGLLLIDKASGLTSHDVVAQVRQILEESRVGHAGTLDPMATGLLVLGVGASTRLLRFAQSEVKRYVGTVRLGVATDSLDAQGAVVDERPVPELTSVQATAAATAMLGPQQQVPPMVSALKVNGRRLHELAREGLHVERDARDITVNEFSVTATDNPASWDFEVECTVGTYVRVLLSDLALALGTVGHLSALRRISSGHHHVDQAVTLEQLRQLVHDGRSPLRPPVDFVTQLESTVVDDDQERRLRMGQRIEVEGSFSAEEIAALDARGALVAILQTRDEKWKPQVVLPSASATDAL
ncbi:MAG: tRNA pseudouridine(55) synthase TruB [Acidimicrobiales bacterium]